MPGMGGPRILVTALCLNCPVELTLLKVKGSKDPHNRVPLKGLYRGIYRDIWGLYRGRHGGWKFERQFVDAGSYVLLNLDYNWSYFCVQLQDLLVTAHAPPCEVGLRT